MSIINKINNWAKNSNSIDKISDNILLYLVLVIPSLILICIVLKFFCLDFTFVFTPVIALSVPFLIMKFNKNKDKIEKEDFKGILNQSVFNCLEKFQYILNQAENFYLTTGRINQSDINNKEFKNTKYYILDIPTYAEYIKKLYEFTDRELEKIENSKLQFLDYNNFKFIVKYREILDKYKDKTFKEMKEIQTGNELYKDLYEILEINKDKIKEMNIK